MNGKETGEERESFIFQSFAQLLITLDRLSIFILPTRSRECEEVIY